MCQMVGFVVRSVASDLHEELLLQQVGVMVRLQRARLSKAAFHHVVETDAFHELRKERYAAVGCHVATGEIDREI